MGIFIIYYYITSIFVQCRFHSPFGCHFNHSYLNSKHSLFFQYHLIYIPHHNGCNILCRSWIHYITSIRLIHRFSVSKSFDLYLHIECHVNGRGLQSNTFELQHDVHWNWFHILTWSAHGQHRFVPSCLGLYSLINKASYRQMSWRFEAARSDVLMIVSHWHLTGMSAALLPRCLSIASVIGKV